MPTVGSDGSLAETLDFEISLVLSSVIAHSSSSLGFVVKVIGIILGVVGSLAFLAFVYGGIVFLTSIVGSVMGTIFYTAALVKINFISFSVVVLLQQTQPIFAIFLASIVLKEKLTSKYGALALIGLIAAYFLAFPDYGPQFTYKSGETTAALFAMGAAVSWGSATVLGKLLLKRLSFASAAAARFMFAIPLAYIASVLLNQTIPISSITLTQWTYLIAIALSSGMVAFLIYYKGLTYTQAKISTFAEMTWPISAAFIGFVFLKDRLTIVQAIAGTVLLIDILILSLTSNKNSNEKA